MLKPNWNGMLKKQEKSVFEVAKTALEGAGISREDVDTVIRPQQISSMVEQSQTVC